MYPTSDLRFFIDCRIKSLQHYRLLIWAKIEHAAQKIFKLPFATLTLSVLFGYQAALSSIHPVPVCLLLILFSCFYAIGLNYTTNRIVFSVDVIKSIVSGTQHQKIRIPLNVLFFTTLHIISFIVTLNGIRSDVAKADALIRLSSIDSIQEFRGQVLSKEKEAEQYCSYIIRAGNGVKMLLYTNQHSELLCGQDIEVSGKIEAFTSARNPGGFDSANYYRSQGIYYSINSQKLPIVRSDPSIIRRGLNFAFKISEMIRDHIIVFWIRILGDEKAGFLGAVLFGLKDGMNADIKSAMRMSNLSHLVAVSGLHVSMIIAPFISVISVIGLDRKRKKIINVVTLIFLGFLTGYTPSVSRAVIMNLISIINSTINRKNSPINNLFFSSLVLLSVSPYYAGNLGFILSFSATLGIILFSKRILDYLSQMGVPKYLSSSFATFGAAQMGMLPMLIQMSGRQSPVLVIVALFAALPAQGICFLTFPASFLALLVDCLYKNSIIEKTIMLPSYVLSDILSGLSIIGQKGYYSATSIRDIPLCWVIALLVFVMMFLSKRKYTPRILLLCAAVLFIVGWIELAVDKKNQPIATLIFADVGQGDCIILKTNTRCVVIDGGDDRNGDGVLLPILDYFGIYKPDMTLLTHLHKDHFAGLLEAAEQQRIHDIGTPYFQSFQELSIEDSDRIALVDFFEVNASREIRLSDEITLQILSPHQPCEKGDNEDSLAILLQVDEFSALLMGDSGFDTEQKIMYNYSQLFGQLVEIDFLKVGHHGSKYSTSDAFLELTNPRYAVISVGNNYFGHPSSEAVNRIENNGTEIFRTDLDGAVIVYVYNNHYKVETMLG